ncbi:MAG: adenine deaminase [Phycisphaerales bacterium]|nr:adenine deaminase [Phycisphaerales bacterium]
MPQERPTCTPVARTDPKLLAVARGDEPCDLVIDNARIVNVATREIVPGRLGVFAGRIAIVSLDAAASINAKEHLDLDGAFLAPGLIDAHMHVESTMLPPSRFARLALPHGTTAAVFDPHEIANVLGPAGIRWIAADAANVPFCALWALSSCVPSAPLETSGAAIDAHDLARLFDEPALQGRIVALAEMMNYPGVVFADKDVLAKVTLGLQRAIVDGHAPQLVGQPLNAYVAAGISSDHECTTLAEAREKLRQGMHIHIREGSAARNLEALAPLITPDTASRISFCTDDRHPKDLRDDGHIDNVVRKAIAMGVDPILALACGSLHTADHYRQPDLGMIAPGRLANMIVFDDITAPVPRLTFVDGAIVAREGHATFEPPPLAHWPHSPVRLPAHFDETALRIAGADGTIRVIGMHADQLVTDALERPACVCDGHLVADASRDLLKLAVIERHRGTGNIGLGFVEGFRFKGGAIASTVGHDAHNLAVVGDNDRDMVVAARALAEAGGGQCVVSGGDVKALLPLPIAGLMSDQSPEVVIEQQDTLLRAAHALGCPHHDPFMPLSFLPLPVIPHLKLSDLGLVDVDQFKVVPLTV